MLGNSLTVNFGTLASPDEQTLPKINNDGYSSEYRLKADGVTYDAIIRHSAEKNKVGGLTVDRHQVLVRKTEAPTEIYPQGRFMEAYIIVRVPSTATADELGAVVNGVSNAGTEHYAAISNWES